MGLAVPAVLIPSVVLGKDKIGKDKIADNNKTKEVVVGELEKEVMLPGRPTFDNALLRDINGFSYIMPKPEEIKIYKFPDEGDLRTNRQHQMKGHKIADAWKDIMVQKILNPHKNDYHEFTGLNHLAEIIDYRHPTYLHPSLKKEIKWLSDMNTTCKLGATSYILSQYIRDCRHDIEARALEVCLAGMLRQINDMVWHNVLSGAADRNMVVTGRNDNDMDDFYSLIKNMQRNMKINRYDKETLTKDGELTKLFISPEVYNDIELHNREFCDLTIYGYDGSTITSIYGTQVHIENYLGQIHEYQNHLTDDLKCKLPKNHPTKEFVIGANTKNPYDCLVLVEDLDVKCVQETPEKFFFQMTAKVKVGNKDCRNYLIGAV